MEKKQFVVVGLGRFGATLAATLCANGGEVMAIDINGERVEAIRDHVTHCVQANGNEPRSACAAGRARF